MAARTRPADARKSAVRSAMERAFARKKGPMALVVRSIGIARAQVKIGLANLADCVGPGTTGHPIIRAPTSIPRQRDPGHLTAVHEPLDHDAYRPQGFRKPPCYL